MSKIGTIIITAGAVLLGCSTETGQRICKNINVALTSTASKLRDAKQTVDETETVKPKNKGK